MFYHLHARSLCSAVYSHQKLIWVVATCNSCGANSMVDPLHPNYHQLPLSNSSTHTQLDFSAECLFRIYVANPPDLVLRNSHRVCVRMCSLCWDECVVVECGARPILDAVELLTPALPSLPVAKFQAIRNSIFTARLFIYIPSVEVDWMLLIGTEFFTATSCTYQ